MTDILDTKYITINKDGVFVGGQPTISYYEQQICQFYSLGDTFAAIQAQNPEMQELHVGAFRTPGDLGETGNPSGVFGKYSWCRVKLFDGRLGPWVGNGMYSSASSCAAKSAAICVSRVRGNPAMRSSLLNFAKKDKEAKEQYETVSVIKDGIYRITIERIKQR